MGCDIHLQVQRRNSRGEWKAVDKMPPRDCSWCEGAGHYKNRPSASCYSCNGTGKKTDAYDDRNYTTFGVLAGVRDRNVTPISAPRGLPDGVTNKEYVFGDHSQSWLTLAELLAHDWGQPTSHGGWVDGPTYIDWVERGRGWPKEWSGMVAGGAVKHVSELEMQALVAKGEATHSHYTQISWDKPLSESCSGFCQFMESLRMLGEPEDVRIVFGFDS